MREMQIETPLRFYVLQTEWQRRLRRQMTRNVGVDLGKGGLFSLWVGVKTGLGTMEIHMAGPQKPRSRSTI